MRVTALLLASVLCVCARVRPGLGLTPATKTASRSIFRAAEDDRDHVQVGVRRRPAGARLDGQQGPGTLLGDRRRTTREAPRCSTRKRRPPASPGDERSCGLTQAGRGYWKEDMAGALLWATYEYIQRHGKITHLAYAWQDLVWGHELQMLNPDGSRTFAFIAMHKNKLYIFEGTAPKGCRRRCCSSSRWATSTRTATGCATGDLLEHVRRDPEFFPAQPKLTGQGGGGAGAAARRWRRQARRRADASWTRHEAQAWQLLGLRAARRHVARGRRRRLRPRSPR